MFWFLAFILLACGASVLTALVVGFVAFFLIRLAQANGL